MLTTIFDALGLLLAVAFAYVVWPPLALLMAALACFAVSWAMSGRPAPRMIRERRGERS